MVRSQLFDNHTCLQVHTPANPRCRRTSVHSRTVRRRRRSGGALRARFALFQAIEFGKQASHRLVGEEIRGGLCLGVGVGEVWEVRGTAVGHTPATPSPTPLENARTSAVDATPMMTAKNRATTCTRMVPFFLSVGVCCFVKVCGREMARAKRRANNGTRSGANRDALLGKTCAPKSGLATAFTEGHQPHKAVRVD